VPDFDVPLEDSKSKVSKSVSISAKKLNSTRLGVFDKEKNTRRQQVEVDSIFEQKSQIDMKKQDRRSSTHFSEDFRKSF
jgi:hypothetical protein